MFRRWTALLLACALSFSCSDDDQKPPDGAAPDVGVDAGLDSSPGDAAPDQPAGDGPVSACDPALDIAPLTLDSSYCVVRRFSLAGGTSAVALKGNTLYAFSLDTQPAGGVSQTTIDPLTGKPGTYSAVFTFTPGLSGTLFAGAYLALSPAGHAAVGYTEDKTFEGQIFWGSKGSAAPKMIDKASGNFDVVFLDNQTLLVNGMGLGPVQEGQGVYLYQEGKTPRRLITDIGTMSGFMALGKKVLYAGGYFTGGSKLYGFSLTEVQAAVSGGTTLTPAADGDLIFDGSAGDATALGDDLVVASLDSNWAFEKVTRIPVAVSGDTVTPGTAADLVTTSTGVSATVGGLVAGTGGELGLMLPGASTELAIVTPK